MVENTRIGHNDATARSNSWAGRARGVRLMIGKMQIFDYNQTIPSNQSEGLLKVQGFKAGELTLGLCQAFLTFTKEAGIGYLFIIRQTTKIFHAHASTY